MSIRRFTLALHSCSSDFNHSGRRTLRRESQQNPNVHMGAGDFVVPDTVVRPEVMSAVGGQSKIRIEKIDTQ